MAVIELAVGANPINNNLASVNLSPTHVRTGLETNTITQGYPFYDPAAQTAAVVADFATKLDDRFFNQLFINGGTA